MTKFHIARDQAAFFASGNFAQAVQSGLIFDILADPVVDDPIG
jgi:hypothetical protein